MFGWRVMMVRFICVIAAVLMANTTFGQCKDCQRGHVSVGVSVQKCVGGRCGSSAQSTHPGYSHPAYTGSGLAQEKADLMANTGYRGHVRRGEFGGAGYEGVGWGSTPEAAVTNACGWGKRKPTNIGVSCRNGTCYATVLYW